MSIKAAQDRPLTSASAGEMFLPEAHQSIVCATLDTLGVWMRRSDERRALRELAQDDRLLSDIGITRELALREAARPFWRR